MAASKPAYKVADIGLADFGRRVRTLADFFWLTKCSVKNLALKATFTEMGVQLCVL